MKILALTTLVSLSLWGSTAANRCSASNYQALLQNKPRDAQVSEECTSMVFKLCCDDCGDTGATSRCWGKCMANVEPAQQQMITTMCTPKFESCDAFVSNLNRNGEMNAFTLQAYSDCCGTECDPSFGDMQCYASCMMKQATGPSFVRRLRKNTCSASSYQAMLRSVPRGMLDYVSEECTKMGFKLCCDDCGDEEVTGACWRECMEDVDPAERRMLTELCMPKTDTCDDFLSLLNMNGQLPGHVMQQYSNCCGTECEPSMGDMQCYETCMMKEYQPWDSPQALSTPL